ncbi:MAG: glycosyltransferase family 2 protein [Clostridiales bacterium]
MDMVSVIIPIYNVEKYLVRCLDSVCNQTYYNLEIICVNDGSQDNCDKICEDYSKIDSRIKFINKENGGSSSARNAGLNIATGKFIYFIDPDDYIKRNALSKMVLAAKENKCQVVISGYKTNPSGEEIIPLYELNKQLIPKEMIIENKFVHSHNDLCFVWRFLFETSIIKENNIRFNTLLGVGEDFIFNLEVLLKCSSAYVLKESLYYYTVNNKESIMNKPYKNNLESNLILQYDLKKKLSVNGGLNKCKTYMDDMSNYYINAFFPMIMRNIYNSNEKNKIVAIKRVLNYKMFRESCKQIGFLYKCSNYKKYILYLAIKYRVSFIIHKVYNKAFGSA